MNGEFELRRGAYEGEAWIEERRDIEEFTVEIDRGIYPVKCLNCYEIGLRWCRWWGENFECGSFEAEKSLNIIKAFFNRGKRRKRI